MSPVTFLHTVQPRGYLCVYTWQMLPSPGGQICWPQLRPNTDWKISFLKRGAVLPRPWTVQTSCDLYVFLSAWDTRRADPPQPAAFTRISVLVSTRLASPIILLFFHSLLMSSRQSIILCLSITFLYILLHHSPPSKHVLIRIRIKLCLSCILSNWVLF